MTELIDKVMTLGAVTEYMAEKGYKVHEIGMDSPWLALCETSSELEAFHYISYTDGDAVVDVFFEPVSRDIIGKPYDSWLVMIEDVNTNEGEDDAE